MDVGVDDRTSSTWMEITKTGHGHGGPGWEFGTCLWSPTVNHGGAKAYNLMLEPRPGDLVLHMLDDRGTAPSGDNSLVGLSRVKSRARIVAEEPPSPGPWSGMAPYFRIDLTGYETFRVHLPVRLLLTEYAAPIREEILQDRPKYYPFTTYGPGLRTAQGMYLARCTKNLQDLFGEAIGIEESVAEEYSALEGGASTTGAHREYAEGQQIQAERRFFARNPGLARAAKDLYGHVCQACGFRL